MNPNFSLFCLKDVANTSKSFTSGDSGSTVCVGCNVLCDGGCWITYMADEKAVACWPAFCMNGICCIDVGLNADAVCITRVPCPWMWLLGVPGMPLGENCCICGGGG